MTLRLQPCNQFPLKFIFTGSYCSLAPSSLLNFYSLSHIAVLHSIVCIHWVRLQHQFPLKFLFTESDCCLAPSFLLSLYSRSHITALHQFLSSVCSLLQTAILWLGSFSFPIHWIILERCAQFSFQSLFTHSDWFCDRLDLSFTRGHCSGPVHWARLQL